MKNLDITIVAPQGAGKSHLARGIFKIMDVAPERIVEMDLSGRRTPEDIIDDLRSSGADAVVFDVPPVYALNLATLSEAVQLYRDYTHRYVAAVYCIQSTMRDFLNP